MRDAEPPLQPGWPGRASSGVRGPRVSRASRTSDLKHNAANEYMGLIERAENGAPRACANWTAPSSGQ
jgi:hypothetical protein